MSEETTQPDVVDDEPYSEPEPRGKLGKKDLQAELSRARRDAARYRTQLRELRAQTQGAQNGGQPQADKLSGQVASEAEARAAAAEAIARTTAVEAAVARLAPKLGADPDALLDSRKFVDKLTKLDPTAEDFADSITSEVKKAVKKNGRFKSTPSASTPGASSSGTFTGSGGERLLTREDLKAMSGTEIREAMDAGKLVHLGFGPSRRR